MSMINSVVGLMFAAAACCFHAVPVARSDDRTYRLIAVSLDTLGKENYLQIACGPNAVQSQARLRLTFQQTAVTLRQEDAQHCDGLWAPIWAAQTMHLEWLVTELVLFKPGEHIIEMWDADWLLGPRRRVAGRYVFQDQGKGKVSKLLPEGYILTLIYKPDHLLER